MVYLAKIVKLVTCQVKHRVEGLEDKTVIAEPILALQPNFMHQNDPQGLYY